MQKPWFAIMNQNTVKIYSEVDSENSLKEIVTLQNPLGRERNRSLVRKQAGHEQKTIGRMSTVRYSHPKRSDPHEIAAKQFAKKIALYLEEERRQNHFLNLTILAEPGFMGKVSASMNANLKKVVVNWIKKDFVKTPKSKLLAILSNLNQDAKMSLSSAIGR
tara:strand:+ start:8605 stop:9090 length:486 start_codon:yes stop_codon:yes gene_type:complete